MAYLKLQSPIKCNEDHIYPLTTYDQIIMPDGVSRWDGQASGAEGTVQSINGAQPDENGNVELAAEDVGAVFADRTEATIGEPAPEKLQKPLRDHDGYFYPLTTYDQIVMPDGVSRWDGKSGPSDGEIDAATLGGIAAEEYALKSDIIDNNVTEEWIFTCDDGSQIIKNVHVGKNTEEDWVFTLKDGTTITKKVLTYA